MQTATSVPACSRMENKKLESPEVPVKYWNRERCPEDETGRNSVSPCRTPCRKAWKTVMEKTPHVVGLVGPAWGPDRLSRVAPGA